MGFYFTGDIDIKLFSGMTEDTPIKLGASYEKILHYFFDKDNELELKENMKEIREKLISFGITVNNMDDIEKVLDISDEEIIQKYTIKSEDFGAVEELLATYYLAFLVLAELEENGECNFYLPLPE